MHNPAHHQQAPASAKRGRTGERELAARPMLKTERDSMLQQCDHVWHPHPTNPKYLLLQGFTNALVRTEPMPDGRFLWQFRKVVSYADTVEKAKDYIEAGAEYFATMRKNPYA